MRDGTRKAARRRPWNYVAWIGGGLIALGLVFAVYAWVYMKPTPIPDIFGILRDQGYTANVGFSGVFAPGNVVQTKEADPDGGERALLTPVLFLWGSDCFPGITPGVTSFVLPQSSGTSSASLIVGAEALSRLVPRLHFDSNAVADFSLQIEKPRVHTLAKGDLSGNFSEKCVRAYDQQLKAGDRSDWYEVILDAVVAERLSFDLQWTVGSSLEARAAAARQVEQALSRALSAGDSGEQASGSEVDLAIEDQKHTVLKSDGPVIIGYRTRPMQPQGEHKSF